MQPFTFFISYRRQDTAPIALLLKNEIEKRIQFVRVAVDVEEIQPGETFPDRLRSLIDGSHATLALIGRNWMPRKDAAAVPPASDWVVNELEYAKSSALAPPEAERFGLPGRLVIPVFIDCERDFRPFHVPASIAYIEQLHAERIDYAGWPTAIGPLLDRIAVRLSLKKRPDADEYPKPDIAKARTQPLPDAELAQILRYDDYEGWYVDNYGVASVRYLVKTFKFHHFNQAADFMNLVSDHCRILDHHPEWRNVFNQVTVSLTTWDAQRRITIYDLGLALYMNMAAKAVAKNA